MRRIAILLALAAAAGCDGPTGPGVPAAAYVRVVDLDGAPLRPDEVAWYHDPQSAAYDGEHPAACRDRLCTAWVVPEGVSGTVYVTALRVRPHLDPHCNYVAYDGKPVAASADHPPTVVLELDTEMVLCD
jgi:hypothetical protein